MTTFKISITINQPVDIVVGALMNPENAPYWTTWLERFEVIEGKPGLVGSVGRLHYRQKGRAYVMEDKLIYCEPGKKYISTVTGDAISAKVETNLISSGDKTEMIIEWTGKGKIFILKLLLPFLRRNMIKQAESELMIFKNLVETKGVNFSDGTRNYV